MCYQRALSTCCHITSRHRIPPERSVKFLPRPPCRKPFPIGDKVTFSGKECVCQTCSQSMTSSKPIKIRGPSRESSPLGTSLSAGAVTPGSPVPPPLTAPAGLEGSGGGSHPGGFLKHDPVGTQPRLTSFPKHKSRENRLPNYKQ